MVIVNIEDLFPHGNLSRFIPFLVHHFQRTCPLQPIFTRAFLVPPTTALRTGGTPAGQPSQKASAASFASQNSFSIRPRIRRRGVFQTERWREEPKAVNKHYIYEFHHS